MIPPNVEFKTVPIVVKGVKVNLGMLHKLPHCISMLVLHCNCQGSHSIIHVVLLVDLQALKQLIIMYIRANYLDFVF